MRSERARLALVDIRDNALLAMQFVQGLSLDAFIADRRTFYAVTRCLEIVSEAARRLPPDLRDRHPELPWRAIMGVGNIYRHDYQNVSESFVYLTVQNSPKSLLVMVAGELRTEDPPAPAPRV
jgi:uncharacterized protein with HEPN domain